jgi:Fe-S-cluster containining protein
VDFVCPSNILFACTHCGLCCGDTDQKTRHILLVEPEAEEIAAKTCLQKQDFCSKVSGKTPYEYEMKKVGGHCFFLKDNQCSIYDLRPLICRFYPFELKFSQDQGGYVFSVTLECSAIGKGQPLARRDFEELFSLAQQRLL